MWIGLLGVLAVLGLGFLLFRPRPLFRIRVRDGEVIVVGRVPAGFVTDCERIFADTGVRDGAVSGHARGDGVRLRFAGGIRREHEQRYRNAWLLHV